MKKYRFIGKNGSMDFEKRTVYTLKRFEYRDKYFYATFTQIRGSYAGEIPYSSLEAFLENWEEI